MAIQTVVACRSMTETALVSIWKLVQKGLHVGDMIVVGDAVNLCSVGVCAKLWLKFIQRANELGGSLAALWLPVKTNRNGVTCWLKS